MIMMLTIGGIVVVLSWFLTGATLRILTRRAILDHPNERSSHSAPVPRGGGLPVIALTLIFWAAPLWTNFNASLILILGAALLLAAISWIDDIQPLSAASRFGVQIFAIFVGIWALPPEDTLFQGLIPLWLDKAAIFVIWLWFVNLFNFMDGIDAISCTESFTICVGLVLLSSLYGASTLDPWHPIIASASIIGFFWWNRPPAQIFLGDVGSITLGFLLGWLLIELAISGYWTSALILPLYYFFDATFTLLRRGLRGEKVWQAHREHFYQKAVQSGKSHGQVSGAILIANLALVGLSISAISHPLISLGLAICTVCFLIRWMLR